MRLRKPRIEPVADDELTSEQSSIVEGLNDAAKNLNIFRTSLRAPTLFKSIMVWSNYLGSKQTNAVPLREKELIVLRTSYLCKCGYEWSHHAYLALKAGLTQDEVDALRDAKPDHEWGRQDQALVDMCEQLVKDQFVRDETWKELEQFFSQKQLMDAVYTCAHYTMASATANAFGIQIDKGVPLDEGLTHYGQ